jgi:hypothetical protein
MSIWSVMACDELTSYVQLCSGFNPGLGTTITALPVFDVEVVPLHDVVQMEVFGVTRVAVPARMAGETPA